MAMLPVKTLLWPTDFSEPSYQALEAAVEFAGHFKAEILSVHVLEPPPRNSEWADASKLSVPLPVQEDREQRERELNDLLAARVPDKVPRNVFVLIGDAAHSILDLAEARQVDLIVISTHGRTGWRRLVFGSVAEQVIRDAACPVLTIRQERNSNQKEG